MACGSPNKWWTTTANSSQDEAVRRSLERCGYTSGVPCMVMGIDDTFVIPIPTLAKVVGFYRPEGLVGVKPDARDEIAHRLAVAPNALLAEERGPIAGHANHRREDQHQRRKQDEEA